MKMDNPAVLGTIGVILVSILAIPTCYLLSLSRTMDIPIYVFLAGVVIAFALVPIIIYFLVLRNFPAERRDIYFYVFTVFAFTAVVDLLIAFTLDDYTSLLMFYLEHGEPGESFRYYGLFWVGSIMNSILVFLPGNLIGSWALHVLPSYFLNVPYAFFPVSFAWRELVTRGRIIQNRPTKQKPAPILSRPTDLVLVLCCLACVLVFFFKFVAVMGNPVASVVKNYVEYFEPHLLDPSQWPRLQVLLSNYYYIPAFIAFIRALIYPDISHYAPDLSALVAGGLCQGTVSYIVSSLHSLSSFPTPNYVGVSKEATPHFLAINLFIMVVAIAAFFRFSLNEKEFNVKSSTKIEKTRKKR